MSTILINSRSGPDAKLHLEVPVDKPNAEFEIELVVRAKSPVTLPADYFKLIGSVSDDTLTVRGPLWPLSPLTNNPD